MTPLDSSPIPSSEIGASIVSGKITVGVTTVPVRVGASNLVGRELVYIENTGAQSLYYGPSGVTTSTGATLYKFQSVFLPINDEVTLYIISGTAGGEALVQEMA